jgi:hypothetical protein
MVMVANIRRPSITAQDAGRELFHRRQDVVKIIGDDLSLKKIAWIFAQVPDMFKFRRLASCLIVCLAEERLLLD